MKLPSLSYLSSNAVNTLRNFPLTILSSFVAVCLGIFLFETKDDTFNRFPFINAMLCSALGIPLFFGLTMFNRRKDLSQAQKWLVYASGLLVLTIVYFFLPGIETTRNTGLPYIKYAIYNITCHLLVSFIPFLFRQQPNAFWHYNKELFIRFIVSQIYSGVLFAGISFALAALKLLFDVPVPDGLFFETGMVTICFFNTWFFCGGAPKDLDELETSHDYPKGIRIFSQFVLIPLLALYLIILYAYGTRILVLWDWPRGIVSNMIICISVLGIFTFLLLHPFGKDHEQNWIRKFSKAYYFLLLPLLVLLFIAIFMRLEDYGITINRFIILMLGVWLTVVCFFVLLRNMSLRFFPLSLSVLLVLVSFGPWGMFAVSERSQVNRLQKILESAKLFENGKIKNETLWVKDSLPEFYANVKWHHDGLVSDSLQNEIKSILDYLDDFHGFAAIRPWFNHDIDSLVGLREHLTKQGTSVHEPKIYMESMGLKYLRKTLKKTDASIDFNASYNFLVKEVSGYDYLVGFNHYGFTKEREEILHFELDTHSLNLIHTNYGKSFLLETSGGDTMHFDVGALVSGLKMEFGNPEEDVIPQQKMQIISESSMFEVKMQFFTITLNENDSMNLVSNVSGEILIKKKSR